MPQHEKISDNFDPLVESKFKEFVVFFMKNYRTNATRKKMAHIILNLPLGFFMKEEDLEGMCVKNKAPSYHKFIEMINGSTFTLNMPQPTKPFPGEG